MRDPDSRSFGGVQITEDSWLGRVRANFRQFLLPTRRLPSPANGVPIHLLPWEKSARSGRAQGASLLAHAGIIMGLALIVTHPFKDKKILENDATKVLPSLKFPAHFFLPSTGRGPDPGAGSGGARVPIPATAGDLVPVASLKLVRPSLPPKKNELMPVPPTIFDPTAAPMLTAVDKIGLPWMKEETNSPGPGNSNTIGNGPGHTMGDGPHDGPGGEGESGTKFHVGSSLPRCAYCPDPQYTDEAREAKLEGTVTLQVLVSADGRASQIRIVNGIGLGLDEHAVQAIKGWKFVPAHDGGRRAVPAWVTVEAIFRLF